MLADRRTSDRAYALLMRLRSGRYWVTGANLYGGQAGWVLADEFGPICGVDPRLTDELVAGHALAESHIGGVAQLELTAEALAAVPAPAVLAEQVPVGDYDAELAETT